MLPTLTITRMSNGDQGDMVRVEIRDGRRLIFKGYLSLKNFALAITGRGEVPFSDRSPT